MMMKAKLYFLFFALLSASLFASCKKDQEVIIPPDEAYYLKLTDTTSKSFLVDINGIEKNVEISTNLPLWTATVETGATGWCSVQKTGSSLKVKVSPNNDNPFRSCTITLSGSNVDAQSIMVYQLGSNTAGGINGDIQIPVSSAVASEDQSGYGIEKSYDGNMATNYESRWSSTTFPVTLEYFFTAADKIDYFVYYPRTTGGSNGYIGELEVWYKANGSNEYVKFGDFDFGKNSSVRKVLFEPSLLNPKAIKLVVKSGLNNFVTCGEIEFYTKNTSNTIPAIFADDICSALKPGTTLEQINALGNAFFKNLALELYTGNYPMEFRVQEYEAYPDPAILAATNKTYAYSRLDNPTGMCLSSEGEEFVAFLSETNFKVSLRIIDWRKGYSGAEYILSPGLNKIKSSSKGLIYVMYHTSDPAAQPVKVHIALAHINGYFNSQKHSSGDWKRLLNGAVDLHFDVLGQYAHLCFPVQSFKEYTPDGKALIDAYDELVYAEQDFAGLFKYNKANKNRMFCQGGYSDVEFNGFYMYADNYRTNYNVNTLSEICNVTKFKTEAVWGPAHEIGHVNQTRPGLKWLGMTEVTTNIYSLYVQTLWGNTSRLESDKPDTYSNCYESAFSRFVGRDTVRFAAFGDPFMQLIPFWQLHLYFAKVENDPDFYKRLHEAVRTQPDPIGGGAGQLNFYKLCCDESKTDLTDFFTAWAFLYPITRTINDYGTGVLEVNPSDIAAAKSYVNNKKYPLPGKLIQYITDSNIAAFLTDEEIIPGTAEIRPPNDRAILQNWKNVVVFEVYDGSALKMTLIAKPTVNFDARSYTSLKIYAVAADGTKVQAYPVI